jgi:hypothetical protein
LRLVYQWDLDTCSNITMSRSQKYPSVKITVISKYQDHKIKLPVISKSRYQ